MNSIYKKIATYRLLKNRLYEVFACTNNISYLDVSSLYSFQAQAVFVWKYMFYICNSTIYVNKNHHCYSWHKGGSQGCPLLSTNVEYHPCMGLLLPVLFASQSLKKRKIEIKSYLDQTGLLIVFTSCFK